MSKLKLLEQKLGRGSIPDTPVSENAANKMMASYAADVERKAKAEIKLADDKRIKVEADNAALVAQLADVSKELSGLQKTLSARILDVKDAAKQEMDAMRSKHCGEMEQMQSQIDALRGQMATERQDKIKAQTQLEAEKGNCAKLEQQVSKLQSAKPAPVAAPKPTARPMLKFRVTQRDEMGNIVTFEQTA